MKILIVGGGIAGLALAGLLRQRGIEPVVVERVAQYGEAGYFLSLWPLGSRVLMGLGVHKRYMGASYPVSQYRICDEAGEAIKELNLAEQARPCGDLQIVTRRELLAVLKEGLGSVPVRMNTSVTSIAQSGDGVLVELTNGEREAFDLVVGADGIHSKVRELVFGDVPLSPTGWGGWGFWTKPGAMRLDVDALEVWGVGRFVGAARVGDRVGGFFSTPVPSELPTTEEDRMDYVRRCFADVRGIVPELLASFDDAEHIRYIELEDVTTPTFYSGRVVLVGDAGAGFLPTAGVGASMALESAAVLHDELLRADAVTIPRALELFEKRRRPRIERIQQESRRFAWMMFTRSPLLAGARNLVIHAFLDQEKLFARILDMMAEPI
jgi:2-polyprenyl-6-methoxyphenol hydroxylase-like FAD-dependent oxidoreductase